MNESEQNREEIHMGFLQKTRSVILGNLNELLDKTTDMNSIPVLKQDVRDLEDALASARHQAAVAAAQVTTLTREQEQTTEEIKLDKQRAQAFLAQSNETAARAVATRIADHQHTSESLASQIAAAKEQAQFLDLAVEKLKTKHDAILNRVRELDGKDRSAKALEQGNASMKAASAILGQGVDDSVDDIARRVDSRSDVAREEFKRTVGELDTPEDPLKTKAVDDILASLKSETAA